MGTATLRTALSTGLHTISAIFDPTAAYASSISAAQTVTVSGANAASTGTFSLGGPFPAPEPVNIESADFNNDGFPDISYVGFQDARAFSLGQIMNHGDGTFGYPPTFTPTNRDLIYGPGSGSEPIYADYNGDGVLDYASESNAFSYQLGTAHDKMAVNLGAGDGTFPTGVVLIPSFE